VFGSRLLDRHKQRRECLRSRRASALERRGRDPQDTRSRRHIEAGGDAYARELQQAATDRGGRLRRRSGDCRHSLARSRRVASDGGGPNSFVEISHRFVLNYNNYG
jgi:hypothetical protein